MLVPNWEVVAHGSRGWCGFEVLEKNDFIVVQSNYDNALAVTINGALFG